MPFHNNSKYFRFWQIFLIPVFVFIVIHFLKDITQDLLGIPTVLDIFGNVNEDLSSFHPYAIWIYHWFMVNTIILELFLLINIPITWRRKKFSKIDIITVLSLIYLFFAFTVAVLLDPRFFK